MHGISYTSTMLLQPTGDNTFEVVDRDESVNWSQKFPQTKFAGLFSLSSDDASIALRIVLEILRLLSTSQNQPLSLTTISSALRYEILFQENFDIDTILEHDT